MGEWIPGLFRDLKQGMRSLQRGKGVALAVMLTLALGIGANCSIFSLVRGILLRPLPNRDEARLIYIRQSAPGDGNTDAAFSVPEIEDFRARLKSFSELGEFSALGFTLVGLGQPRSVHAGVVNGTYFDVMGLRPVLGRLLGPKDDGPNAPGEVVLTYRFWSTTLHGDPHVIGKQIRLDSFFDARSATVVGVLEPSVPFPMDTELMGNIVTSSHHLGAEMQTNRLHRMTELFGRLAPGVTLDAARSELQTVYSSMKAQHRDSYPENSHFSISATRFRDQLSSNARTILLVLMATSILVFIVACCNVANLVLARTVRRESELSIRAAMGAGASSLRRILLAESLIMCGGGALIGVAIASPLVAILAKYFSRYSVRALDINIDFSMLWVGVGLAVVAAFLLAYIPRLPGSGGAALTAGPAGTRVTAVDNRKFRIFAVVQIAASFVLVTSSVGLVKTLLALEEAQSPYDMQHVLAVDVPVMHANRTPQQIVKFYMQAADRIREMPGVQNVAIGTNVPWRDTDHFALGLASDVYKPQPGQQTPHAEVRVVTPGYFAALGIPIAQGRDFTDADREGTELVVILTQSAARELFPNGDALNHYVMWNDPILQVLPFMPTKPQRVIGIVRDLDDFNLIPEPTRTVYAPFAQEATFGGGRLFVHTSGNPYALAAPIKQLLRTMSSDQPVERPATLSDIRAEVLSTNRIQTLIFGVFAGVALLIAVVGIAGVLAFSVTSRTREFGIRLAVGAQPVRVLSSVVSEGLVMAGFGLLAGIACGYALQHVASSMLSDLRVPGMAPIVGAAAVLIAAVVTASVIPAIRAARIDVVQALRGD